MLNRWTAKREIEQRRRRREKKHHDNINSIFPNWMCAMCCNVAIMSQQLNLVYGHVQSHMRWNNRSHNWVKLSGSIGLTSVPVWRAKTTTMTKTLVMMMNAWEIYSKAYATDLDTAHLHTQYHSLSQSFISINAYIAFECQSWRSALVFNTLHSHQVHRFAS